MKDSSKGLFEQAARNTYLIPLLLTLHGCGSSGSGESVFTKPVDAQTLATFLVTGANSSDSEAYRNCTTAAHSVAFHYRLYEDSTGTETRPDEPNFSNEFTWRAASSASFEINLTEFDLQHELFISSISGADQFDLLSVDNETFDCNRISPQLSAPVTGHAGNSLNYQGVDYALTHGFEESYIYNPGDDQIGHRISNFQLANSRFTLTQIFIDFIINISSPPDATVRLRADLHSPGESGFDTATFTFVPDHIDEDGPEVAGTFFFNDASFGIDSNGDGDIDSDDGEFFDVTGGSIDLDRISAEDKTGRMTFDLTLENGESIRGEFEGEFPLFANQI